MVAVLRTIQFLCPWTRTLCNNRKEEGEVCGGWMRLGCGGGGRKERAGGWGGQEGWAKGA